MRHQPAALQAMETVSTISAMPEKCASAPPCRAGWRMRWMPASRIACMVSGASRRVSSVSSVRSRTVSMSPLARASRFSRVLTAAVSAPAASFMALQPSISTSWARWSATRSRPSPVRQLVRSTGRPFRTSSASPLHEREIDAHVGRQVRLVDDEQVGPDNAGAALARNVAAAGDVDHEHPVVHQVEGEGGGEVVAAAFDQDQIEGAKLLLQQVGGLDVERRDPRGSRCAGRRRPPRPPRARAGSGRSAAAARRPPASPGRW